MKTSELRPCDKCGGSIMPIFYRLKIEFRQLAIDQAAVNEVVGTAKIYGGNMAMGSIMSPNRDATVEMPGYRIDKDIFLCQSCVLGMGDNAPFSIRPVDMMAESERQSTGDESC